MGLLFTIFFIWLIYMLMRPLIKMWRISRKFRAGDPSVFADLFGNPGAQQSSSSRRPDGRRKAGWSMPGIKRKKINKDVGEYVRYQEIKVTATEQTSTSDAYTSYTREEQISDVEWEEIN